MLCNTEPHSINGNACQHLISGTVATASSLQHPPHAPNAPPRSCTHLPARSTMRNFPLTVEPSGQAFSSATVTMQCERLLVAFMAVAGGLRGGGVCVCVYVCIWRVCVCEHAHTHTHTHTHLDTRGHVHMRCVALLA